MEFNPKCEIHFVKLVKYKNISCIQYVQIPKKHEMKPFKTKHVNNCIFILFFYNTL